MNQKRTWKRAAAVMCAATLIMGTQAGSVYAADEEATAWLDDIASEAIISGIMEEIEDNSSMEEPVNEPEASLEQQEASEDPQEGEWQTEPVQEESAETEQQLVPQAEEQPAPVQEPTIVSQPEESSFVGAGNLRDTEHGSRFQIKKKKERLFLENGLPNANSGYFAPCFHYQYDDAFRGLVSTDGSRDEGSRNAFMRRGCGPTMMANIISVLTDQSVTPQDVATMAETSGSGAFTYGGGDGGYKIVPWACGQYGLEYEPLGTDMEKIREALENGYIVAVVGAGQLCANGGTSGSAHYGYLYSYDPETDCTVFVGQAELMSPTRSRFRRTQAISMSELETALMARKGVANGGPAWAITGYSESYEGRTAKDAGAFEGFKFDSANRMGTNGRICLGCWAVEEKEEAGFIASDGFLYKEKDGSAVIVGYYGGNKYVDVPSVVSGLPVKAIGKTAFSGTDAAYITIPEGVEDVRDSAFASCSALKAVHFPSTISHIGKNVFSGSPSLSEAGYIPTGTRTEEGTFSGMKRTAVLFMSEDSPAWKEAVRSGLSPVAAFSGPAAISGIKTIWSDGGTSVVAWNEDPAADGFEVIFETESRLTGFLCTEKAEAIIPEGTHIRIRPYQESFSGRAYGAWCDYEIR